MAALTPSTIILKGDPPRFEKAAGGTITPGDLVEIAADGDLEVHGTAGANAAAMFAIENELGGDEIDHDYLITENVVFVHFRPGEEIYAWLADGQNVAEGDFLESASGGDLRGLVTSSGGVVQLTQNVVAMALEDLDLSVSASITHARIKVRAV